MHQCSAEPSSSLLQQSHFKGVAAVSVTRPGSYRLKNKYLDSSVNSSDPNSAQCQVQHPAAPNFEENLVCTFFSLRSSKIYCQLASGNEITVGVKVAYRDSHISICFISQNKTKENDIMLHISSFFRPSALYKLTPSTTCVPENAYFRNLHSSPQACTRAQRNLCCDKALKLYSLLG